MKITTNLSALKTYIYKTILNVKLFFIKNKYFFNYDPPPPEESIHSISFKIMPLTIYLDSILNIAMLTYSELT